jgi:hypothetical protein
MCRSQKNFLRISTAYSVTSQILRRRVVDVGRSRHDEIIRWKGSKPFLTSLIIAGHLLALLPREDTVMATEQEIEAVAKAIRERFQQGATAFDLARAALEEAERLRATGAAASSKAHLSGTPVFPRFNALSMPK